MSVSSPEKKALSAPINKEVLEEFKAKCKELNIPMSTVIEMFCREFNKGKFEFKFARAMSIELTDDKNNE